VLQGDGMHAVILALHDLHRNSRVLKQAQTLHEAGFEVTAVGIVRRSTDAESESTPFGRIVRVRTTDRLYEERKVQSSGTSVRGDASRYTLAGGLRTLLGRMRDNLLMARAAASLDPDVIIASDLTAWAAGYRVRQLTGSPLIVDARDLVTDSHRVGHPVYMRMLRRVESYVARRSDALIAVTPLMAQVLAERYPTAPSPTHVYNGPSVCVRQDSVEVHRPLRLLFQGNLLPNRLVDKMIEATVALEGSAVLTIQGFGGQKQELEELVDRLGAQEIVRFVEPCQPHEVAEAAARHDVGLVSNWDDTLNMQVTVGTKLFDYMSGGLAVVASALPMYQALLEEAQCGVVFDPRDPDALQWSLRTLVDDPDEVRRMKRNAVAACPRYSWDVQGKRFLEVVESVMSGGSRGT